ncbi:MAG: hypothetical protein PHV74_09155 [Dehalococcoidia bacterium]|nr:hypothetical protein [Dehalococcoidia bacterium]
MKRKYWLVLFLIVVVLTPILAYAEGSDVSTVDSDIQYAMDASRAHMAAIAIEKGDSAFAAWQSAELVSPQPYYDLKGNLIAYMFAISKDGVVVGHVLAGSALYNYTILESGTGAPYALPSADEFMVMMERDLKVSAKVVELPKPERLVYLGYTLPFAIIEFTGESVGINLDLGYAVRTKDMQSKMMPFDEYPTTKGADGLTLSQNYLNGFPWKNQIDCSWNPMQNNDICPVPSCGKNVQNDCGPATGVMIAAWYYLKGYTNFAEANANWPGLHVAHHALYNEMGTGSMGTTQWNFMGGWEDYAQSKGYNNFDFPWASPIDPITQWLYIKSAIDVQDGVGVLFRYDSPYAQSWHYCAITGYQHHPTELSQRWMQVHNPNSNYSIPAYPNPPYSRIDFVNWWANAPMMWVFWFQE